MFEELFHVWRTCMWEFCISHYSEGDGRGIGSREEIYVPVNIFQCIARIMMSRKFQGIFQSYGVQSIKVGEAFFILYVATVYIKPFSEKANPRH